MFYTDRIFTLEAETLGVREGNIIPDIDEIITDTADAQRAVHVTGLKAGDFVVFISVSMDEPAVGYFVSKFDSTSGDGVLVSGDAIEQSPNVWLSGLFKRQIRMVDPGILEEFGLSQLVTFLKTSS